MATGPQDLPHLPPGQLESVLRGVRTRPRGSETSAGATEEGSVELQRGHPQLGCLELIEELLRLERTVEASDARVIAPDDEVRDAIVFPYQGVEDRFAWAGVSHRSGECREQR